MVRVLGCPTLLVLAGLGVSVSIKPALALGAPDVVREFIAEPHIHGIPYTRARALGHKALPILYAMLREDDKKQLWWKVVITIGDIGHPSSFDSLHAFMWDRFTGPIDLEILKAQSSALYAIGSLGPDAHRRSIEYLAQGTNPDYWRTLPWTCGEFPDTTEARLILSQSSVAGLGLTGTARARSILTNLQNHPHSPRQLGAIRTAIERNTAIGNVGRAEVERKIEAAR